jgi:regulator of sirC expression with transglutaminase-like and TPR domain
LDPWTATEHPRREKFAGLLEQGGPADLVQGALLIAAREYPDLDLDREMSRISEIGSEAARRIAGMENGGNPYARLEVIRAYLFDELGFHGNAGDYEDPRNSFLNQVMDRRTGIPLTLSIIFIEIARAAGFESRGIALPGHFIARVDLDGRTILVDPFGGGRVLTQEDCRALVVRSTGRASLFRPEILDGASTTRILTRLLRNLKRIFLSREDYPRALAVVDMLLVTTSGEPMETRDRGILMSHLGRVHEAISDLESYLHHRPTAPDLESIRGRLDWLRQRSPNPTQNSP